ncbi:MAG: pectate lyase [Muribaculaceae bacterium]|nr:pectate lyase [Muribaculaceae bacterium]
MKRFLTLLSIPAIIAGSYAQDLAPAFPGAEGHGRYTQGGRGDENNVPEIRHVTNLNDKGEGSFRQAVTGSINKIVVFDVGGYIDLESDLVIGDNTTILGQTAPGDGITLRYRTIREGSQNIIRFIRFRRSQVKDVNDGADATWQRQKSNIILDHVSMSWSIDEVASFYDNKNFTMQWCTVTEGLANPGHSKGAHSYGGIWGGKDASFHHNFIAHVQNRAPRFNGARYAWNGFDHEKYANTVDAERVDFRNCVMYNWGNGNGCYGGPGGGYINMINNYFKAGPGTKNKTRVTQVSFADSSNSSGVPTEQLGMSSLYYIDGNYVTAAGDKAENYDWNGVIYDAAKSLDGERYTQDPYHMYGDNVEYVDIKGVDCVKIKLDEPIDGGEISTHSATEAYNSVLKYVGASLVRDAVDVRLMEECTTGTVTYHGDVSVPGTTATSGTEGILDFINDPEGVEEPKTASFPALRGLTRPEDFDTDGDGIPDEWEIKNGLDPNDPDDAVAFSLDPRGWYRNIEVYANAIVQHIMIAQNENAADALDDYFPELQFITGVDQIKVDKAPSAIRSIEYYSLDGRKLREPQKGINVRVINYEDGTRNADKVIK